MKRPITPQGYAALRDELQKLKAQRPEVAKAIEIARGHGDLSENADYDAAKNKSGMIEAKIRDLESKIGLCEVIDPATLPPSEKVIFGTTVSISDIDSGEERCITIVGEDESDPSNGHISLASPLGRSLIGKREGDTVKVQVPGGTREYEITRIVSGSSSS